MTKELKNTIEELRRRMYNLINERGINDPKVVSASHLLDAALNEYNKKMKGKEKRGDDHVRIVPQEDGYVVMIDYKGVISDVGFRPSYVEAEKFAFAVAQVSKRTRVDVYYLEQKLEQGE
ncbi:aspartyl-phosphate phosphatase Spo0E family protein [Paenibacillus brasilensis]|uniref:Spo0E like sporulation regulatory protein n=1 Tax=Paenibacillus brasilensis TaxID=128574 RepID=A0ABU0KW14_9BACL|nr:aspartyl-phosphate phosphatase Spo0E family protein [Paenibacillus brasilensis]MDQ0492805.1 hypothetical protein [Paenibacillus brasilensis]